MQNMLSERIKAAMKQGGLNQTELAKKTGKTKGAVTQWLNGNTATLKSETSLAIAEATGVSHSWLISGRGSMTLTPAISRAKPTQTDPIAALEAIEALKKSIAPMLLGVVNDALVKWALGQETATSTIKFIEAMAVASKSIPLAPEGVSETPVQTKNNKIAQTNDPNELFPSTLSPNKTRSPHR